MGRKIQGLLLLMILAYSFLVPINASAAFNKKVAGWLPYWDQNRAFNVVRSNSDIFDQLSPFWYDLGSSGELIPLTNSENATLINYAKSNGKLLIPLISNEFNPNLVSSIINNPSLRQVHISNIVDKVVQKGYNGIELDYECLFASDKDALSAFVKDLADTLHAKGKLLIVTVQPKTSGTVNWNGAGAFDYPLIGQSADFVRIMAYDNHWINSDAGSLAPAGWVEQVAAYGVSAIPRNKVFLGIPNYGYDWVGTKGKGVTYEEAVNTANKYGVSINKDNTNGPHYTYSTNGIIHEVWFEDSDSVNTLLNIANKYNVGGIAIWRLGGEDTNMYNAIRGELVGSSNTVVSNPVPGHAPTATKPNPSPSSQETNAPKPSGTNLTSTTGVGGTPVASSRFSTAFIPASTGPLDPSSKVNVNIKDPGMVHPLNHFSIEGDSPGIAQCHRM